MSQPNLLSKSTITNLDEEAINDSVNGQASHLVDNWIAPRCISEMTILYQDDDILLINKPSGLLSLSGKNPLNWDSVHYRLVHGQAHLPPKFPQAKLPHRLDFGTSGIMVVSLNADSAKHLNKQFQARTVQKHYLAILDGHLSNDSLPEVSSKISLPIAKDKINFPKVKICHATGKTAISEYRVLERLSNPNRTLVRFTPHTGRTHQLRIHSHAIGHPIIGCDIYKNEHSEQLASRLQLHASEIVFEHPTTGKVVHGRCPSPF